MNLTILPIENLAKMATQRYTQKGRLDKWALNAGRKYSRMLPGNILQYFWPALCDNRSWKNNHFFLFFSGLLQQVLLYTIKFNGYPIWEVKKNPTDRPIPVKQGRVRGNKNIFKVGPVNNRPTPPPSRPSCMKACYPWVWSLPVYFVQTFLASNYYVV